MKHLPLLKSSSKAVVMALSLMLASQQVLATAPAASLIYSYEEMFQFDLEAYLAVQAPHLLPYAEVISHWSGYSSISPKVMLTLLEQQSGLLRTAPSQKKQLLRPFAGLSQKTDFASQYQDVADQLAQRLYAEPTAEGRREFAGMTKATALDFLFVPVDGSNAYSPQSQQAQLQQASADFAALYQELFQQEFHAAAPEVLRQPESSRTEPNQSAAVPLAGPANGFLQFPFPLGQSWHVGGAHTNTGSGNYPMSSLDMSQGGGWGSNQSNKWVSASAAGSFKRHSSCFAEVVHSGGWSTTYYHLMNVQYNTGANVQKNTAIANPANTQGQALCNGGASTGPHQHWSLKQNGSWTHLNGVYVSGWQITATGSSYDTNCNRYYLTKNGTKKCAGYFSH
jgi:LasA protease